ncbi:ABC transporter substrate-binding protein [Pseudomonas eucalypticola]|uniref:ABC transporter substrate-binding protein n=1 Tax=Pseudomonas eucalypticola TaxID=2599595 RepID=A0A7D5HNX6_9PSED|nr:ABC transporter substrate-binding protein [Pseudomonas eucalypticola]QKZ04848.1 ABC transporter substrate-binding protein [Pseudomonas eucalypticola]
MIRQLCTTLTLSLTLLTHPAHAVTAPDVIRIGAPDLTTTAKPYAPGLLGIAHDRQQLEQAFATQGIKIEWHFFRGAGPAINEAFANGQLDFAFLGDLAAIIGRASGLDTRVLLATRGTNLFLASTPQAGIRRIEDLKGKRIALYRGTADQLSLGRALASVGLSERDLKVINLDWTAANAALLAGQIDATWSNYNLLTLRAKGIEVPVSTKTLPLTATTQATLVGSGAFLQHYPAATQTLVNALVNDAAWVQQPEHYEQYLVAQEHASGIPAALAREESAGANLNFRFSPRLDPFIRASLNDSVEQAAQLKLIRRTFDVQAWFAPAFVDQALRDLKLETTWPAYGPLGQAIAQPGS